MELFNKVGHVDVENLVDTMLASKEDWTAVEEYTTAIMTENNPKKRKTMDTSFTEQEKVYKKKESPEAFTINEAFEEITRMTKILVQNVEQNTKREIKD
ncbi:unnamed protein product [Brassicogethes aeneus]|uniref:Uncharacterized protein n=1 Tax=Brassicogethes aeneus TaxID=1431903 RepID=A0A9P0BEU4_BRAAE|nr:unnamed protein product [Brassicogethes aeneus]